MAEMVEKLKGRDNAMGNRNVGPKFVAWVGEDHSTRHLQWGSFQWQELKIHQGLSMKTIRMKYVAGQWPTNDQLITLADGDPPAKPRHFGGTVVRTEDSAEVTVYID